MVEFDEDEYKVKYKAFFRECDRVRPRKGTKPTNNLELRQEYKEGLVTTYNLLLRHIFGYVVHATVEEKHDLNIRARKNLSELETAFDHLGFSYPFDKQRIGQIDIQKVTEGTVLDDTDQESEENDSDANDSHSDDSQDTVRSQPDILNEDLNNLSNAEDLTETSDIDSVDINDNNKLDSEESETETEITMTQTVPNFMALANQTISFRYNGDPLNLDSFIDSVELLKDFCEPQNNGTMRKFVMTRLEGTAREAIVTTPQTVDDIIQQLRANIKTESSKVIEGRILALRADKSSLTKFAEQAEALADQFRRSLCVEGFSKEKAKEMAVEKTVEMCRRSAKNDTVKAVIAASKFTEPKEVVAKMIVEINNVKQDKPHNSYTHKFNRQNNGNNNNNNGRNFNNNDRTQRFQNNRQNGRGNWRNNGHNNGGNNNNRAHNNNNRSNNHGHNNNRNQNYNGNYYNGNNSNRNSNQAEIRLMTGNETHPGNGGQSQ